MLLENDSNGSQSAKFGLRILNEAQFRVQMSDKVLDLNEKN